MPVCFPNYDVVSLLSKKRKYWPWPLKWLNGRRWWWCGQGVISQSWLSRSSGSCVTFVMSRWLATLPRLTRGAAKELDCRGIVRLNREWGGVRRGGPLPCYNFVPKLYSFFYFIVSIIQSSVRLLIPRPNNGNICTFAAEMMCLKGSPPKKILLPRHHSNGMWCSSFWSEGP